MKQPRHWDPPHLPGRLGREVWTHRCRPLAARARLCGLPSMQTTPFSGTLTCCFLSEGSLLQGSACQHACVHARTHTQGPMRLTITLSLLFLKRGFPPLAGNIMPHLLQRSELITMAINVLVLGDDRVCKWLRHLLPEPRLSTESAWEGGSPARHPPLN